MEGQIKREISDEDIDKYLVESKRQLDQILKIINNLSCKKIVLYGIGQLAYKIVKVIDRSKKVIYVDGDSRNKHKTILETEYFHQMI